MNFLKTIVQAFILASIVGIISCSLSSEEISTDPSMKLRFSTDTIFFDTIFSEIPSVTKRLQVYNDNNANLSIASIALDDVNSQYTLTVNGRPGQSFEATQILANDSMLILVEATLSDRDTDLPYVIEDHIKFITNGNNQEVSVFSWGQDANYLKDSVIACNTSWTSGKPYVIYNNILIDSLCTLTIEPGTRVFSHFGSQIFVKGSLIVEGTADDRAILTNDRFDGAYANFPGQWGGITFLPGSKNNRIQFTDIRNAEIGIWLGTPDEDDLADLIIENSIIENMSETGIAAFTSDLEMSNSLVNNAGQVLFAGLAGGNYILNQNTIANYGFGMFKTEPSFYVSNQLELADGSLIQGPINLVLNNTIIWGSSQDEVQLINNAEDAFNVAMTNNLLRTTNSDYDNFDNILNLDPQFIDPQSFNYQLEEASPAIKTGKPLGYTTDLLGATRVDPPDIGAYEKQ